MGLGKYQPIDSNVPASNKQLRIYPADNTGGITSQLRFLTVLDNPGDTTAGGKMDLYQFNGTARSKDHIIQTTATLTGSLLVNGSVNETQPFDSHRILLNLLIRKYQQSLYIKDLQVPLQSDLFSLFWQIQRVC